MSDCVYDDWGYDPDMRGSLSFFSRCTARYPYAQNDSMGGGVLVYLALVSATDEVLGGKRHNNSHTKR